MGFHNLDLKKCINYRFESLVVWGPGKGLARERVNQHEGRDEGERIKKFHKEKKRWSWGESGMRGKICERQIMTRHSVGALQSQL